MNYFHAELLTASAILPCVDGKCGSLVWDNFHAVPVLAELLSNARRAGTMDSSEVQESTQRGLTTRLGCLNSCGGVATLTNL